MKWLAIHLTPELEAGLRKLMKERGVRRRSDAIRLAVREAAAQRQPAAGCDYRSWLGLGLRAPLHGEPRFRKEDQLWS